jgi:PAS domain S-box-containing protein
MDETFRLFLVEDDDDVAFLMRKSLERAGHSVQVCHNGTDSLLVLRNQSFHLVLLDQRLPDMLGLDMLNAMIADGIGIPVLLVTGLGDEDLAAKAFRAGAIDYVVKDRALGFLAELPKRVHEAITRHRLSQTNRLLVHALDSARDGVMITDAEGRIERVNDAFVRMYGYTRAELVGQTPRLLKSDVQPRELYHDLWQTLLRRQSWQGELVNRRKDGTHVDTSLSITPLVDAQGRLGHFVAIYRDVTERKLMERQLLQAQKMRSVGTLAGGIAHEFNNLLAGIQGYASLALRENNLTPSVKEFLQNVVTLSDRAAHLTRQLLAYARKPTLVRKSASIAAVLRGVTRLVRLSLGIEVELKVQSPEEEMNALVDENQLQQVLVNLCLNARDSMPANASEPLRCVLRRVVLEGRLPAFPQNVPAGDYVVIDIIDHGHGMPPEVLHQAFDPFFTTKDIGKGTGLGLPVAFGIITGHQGYLTIVSEINVGTTVSIYLPRLKDATREGESETPAAAPLPTPAPATILVVDDEEPVLDILRRFLELVGHTVHGVPSGHDAVAKLAEGVRPDLIILDVMIAREEATSNLRNLRARLPHVPVILCTGLIQHDLPTAPEAGAAVEILRKPFRMDELWAVVNRLLTERPSPNL